MTGETWEVFSFTHEPDDLEDLNNNKSVISEGTGGKGSQRLSTLPSYQRNLTPQHRRNPHNCFFPLEPDRRRQSLTMANPNDLPRVEQPPQYVADRTTYTRSPDIRLSRSQRTLRVPRTLLTTSSVLEVKERKGFALARKKSKVTKVEKKVEEKEKGSCKVEYCCKNKEDNCACHILQINKLPFSFCKNNLNFALLFVSDK
eukprot:TRINITY_DN900_c0_g2_i1.p2 TRINITY_DN900_c0_g2~~TRINITY_DN900_c0_g2_i1.p2  ORF type:complete len:201 (-),score=8.07 TRINITY_DN900_c0_g2_i1:596-1198(-)